ncbi:hypothetical protein GGR56DRAFT_125113 [Xylariaceae sp. FL0804]|nr:hypothetical protein GGR56DRAFT_125113 [Xylariaceae sp. FL0804]
MRPCPARVCGRARGDHWRRILNQRHRLYSTERRRNAAAPNLAEQDDSSLDEFFKVDPENKTIATAVGDLPLSPVMDPSFWDATLRHQKTKPSGGQAQNLFEREFRANPFAQALATPVRKCNVTDAHVPKFFLQDFGLVLNPETRSPWWVPRSLVSDGRPVAEEPEPESIQDALQAQVAADAREDAEKAEEAQAGVVKQQEDPRPGVGQSSLDDGEVAEPTRDNSTSDALSGRRALKEHYGPSAYVLARREIIRAFVHDIASDGGAGSGLSGWNRRLFGGLSSRHAVAGPRAVWRQDMDEAVLRLMRRAVADQLLYLARLCADGTRFYLVRCHGWDDVRFKIKGAVLWFGKPEEARSEEEQPGQFATFDVPVSGSDTGSGSGEEQPSPTMTSVLVHNMPWLLGPELAARVKAEAAVLREGDIFMLARRRTAGMQQQLWALQGYLADYGWVRPSPPPRPPPSPSATGRGEKNKQKQQQQQQQQQQKKKKKTKETTGGPDGIVGEPRSPATYTGSEGGEIG